jgi:crotonobetainyl-CoA:carnitine CoA-transferase CaiB-like acyl-CoA transferase
MTDAPASGPLAGLTVVDMSTMMAGPHTAMMLADFGATVVKIETPKKGDPSRHGGWLLNGTSVWWRLFGRNKYAVTLNLKNPEAQKIMRRLLSTADVLIENMRPGKLEAMGLAPDTLWQDNRHLVILRVTGWGQTGPYSKRPSFGTQAEAMSGFTHMNGQPDGAPTLPPITLADGAAGYLGSFAVMAALWKREQDPERRGQVIDLSLIEALFGMLGPIASAHDKLGVIPQRLGSRTSFFAPRNLYRCRDGKWVGISCAAEQIVPRLLAAIGRPELYQDPKFSTVKARLENIEELDGLIQAWMDRYDSPEVIEKMTAAEATVAPVYDIKDVMADPHFNARELTTRVSTEDAGDMRMSNVFPRFSRTPGGIRWTGKALGADNETWLADRLGLSPDDIQRLRADGAM